MFFPFVSKNVLSVTTQLVRPLDYRQDFTTIIKITNKEATLPAHKRVGVTMSEDQSMCLLGNSSFI